MRSARGSDGGYSGEEFLDGRLDELAVWTSVLDGTDVAALYTAGGDAYAAGLMDDLLMAYHFDETSGTTASDYSGNANNATATVVSDSWPAWLAASSPLSTPEVARQYLWSPRYIDSPILRDTYAGGSIVEAERLFYLADANYNVTGLVKYDNGTSTWQVAERYTYTPYGEVTYREVDWAAYGRPDAIAILEHDPLRRPRHRRLNQLLLQPRPLVRRDIGEVCQPRPNRLFGGRHEPVSLCRQQPADANRP